MWNKLKAFHHQYHFYINDAIVAAITTGFILLISLVVMNSLMGVNGFWFGYSTGQKAFLIVLDILGSLLLGGVIYLGLNKPSREWLGKKITNDDRYKKASDHYLKDLKTSLGVGATTFLLLYIFLTMFLSIQKSGTAETYFTALSGLFLSAEYWNWILSAFLVSIAIFVISFVLFHIKVKNSVLEFLKENRNPLVLISRIGDYITDGWSFVKKHKDISCKVVLLLTGLYIIGNLIYVLAFYINSYGFTQTVTNVSVYIYAIISSWQIVLFGIYLAVEIKVGLLGRLWAWLPQNVRISLKGYAYVAPAFIMLFIFTIYPIFSALLMGFVKFDTSGYSEFNYYNWKMDEIFYRLLFDTQDFTSRFTIDHFIAIFQDRFFWNSIITTLFIVLITVPLSTIIALIIAVLLNSIKKLQGLFQTVFFLPYVTSMTAVAAVWRWIFYYDKNGTGDGLFNIFMKSIGLDPLSWLNAGDPLFSFSIWMPWIDGGWLVYEFYPQLIAFLVYSIWAGLAFKIVIFLTGLQGIDKQYYQAAKIDGAGRFKIFRKITAPLLSPVILFITTTSFMGAFQTFTSLKTMFLTDKKIMTVVYYLYNYIDLKRYDRAAAIAVVLFIMISTFTLIRMSKSKRKEA